MARLSNIPDWGTAHHDMGEGRLPLRAWAPVAALTGLSVLVGLFGANLHGLSSALGTLAFLLVFYAGLALVPGALYGLVREAMRDDFAEHSHFWRNTALASAVAAGVWFLVSLIGWIFG